MAYNPSTAIEMVLSSVRCYRDLTRIRRDCVDLLNTFTALRPISSPPPPQSCLPTGAAPLMTFSGTIPVVFQGSRYNIPIRIWIPDSYPYRPPIAFVTPTPDMLISRNHKHVDPSGMVYLPYLNTWNPASHSLLGLVQSMGQTFGAQPPLYARGPNDPQPQMQQAQIPQPPQPYPSYSQQPPQPAYPQSNYSPYNQPPQQPNPYSNQPYPPSSTSVPSPYGYPSNPVPSYNSPANPPINNTSSTETGAQSTRSGGGLGAVASAMAFAQGLLNSGRHDKPLPVPSEQERKKTDATKKLQTKLTEFMATEQKEIDENLKEQKTLEDELKAKKRNLEELEQRKLADEKENLQLTGNLEQLTKWMEENDKPFDVDERSDGADVVKKQLIRAVAMDNMLDDTMYQLDKGLLKGTVTFDVFLKQMRESSAEQFMQRAMIKKIHETISAARR